MQLSAGGGAVITPIKKAFPLITEKVLMFCAYCKIALGAKKRNFD